jgi:hypothetical protein
MMTIEDAVRELEAVAAGWEALQADAEADGNDCFWCCGGGEERRDALEDRRLEVLRHFPSLG